MPRKQLAVYLLENVRRPVLGYITAGILRSHMMNRKGSTNTVASNVMMEKFCVGDGCFQAAIKNRSFLCPRPFLVVQVMNN